MSGGKYLTVELFGAYGSHPELTFSQLLTTYEHSFLSACASRIKGNPPTSRLQSHFPRARVKNLCICPDCEDVASIELWVLACQLVNFMITCKPNLFVPCVRLNTSVSYKTDKQSCLANMGPGERSYYFLNHQFCSVSSGTLDFPRHSLQIN